MDSAETIAHLMRNYESLFSLEEGRDRDGLERLWLENDRAFLRDDPSHEKGQSQAKRNVMLRWQCTIACNFACGYCWQNEERRTAHKHCFDSHPAAIWVESFDRHFGDGARGISLVLSGGEPTLDAGNMSVLLRELCRRSYIRNIRIDTNASWIPKSFQGVESKEKIWLNCSFHPAYFTLDRFVRRIGEFRAAGFNIGMVNFVLTNANGTRFEELRAALDSDIPVNPNPLVNPTEEYDAPTAAVFKQRLPPPDFRYKYEKTNPFGLPCLHPAVAYQMNPQGFISVGCHERSYGNFVVDAELPRLFEGYARCPKTRCDCSDMYSFQKGCNRNLDLNPLFSYKKALLERCSR